MQLIRKKRNSNLELFRIIIMMLIVAHHYVFHSGFIPLMNQSDLTYNSVFLYIIGAWGKTGINCFVLITGYFMCKSQATVYKFFKLLLEVTFYKFFIYILLLSFGITEFKLINLIKSMCPITSVESGFTTAFILYYIFIPFLNKLIYNINKKQHLQLILLCLFIYTGLYMIPGIRVSYNYITWFCILHFIAAYLRIYPIEKIDTNNYFWGTSVIVSITLSIISIFVFRYTTLSPFLWIIDSNAIMALVIAICSFMFFKNLRIRYNKWINLIASSTFGIYLIHDSSDSMRHWLWKETIQGVKLLNDQYLLIYSILSIIIVFSACSLIDTLRIRFIETPLLKNKKYNNFIDKIDNFLK